MNCPVCNPKSCPYYSKDTCTFFSSILLPKDAVCYHEMMSIQCTKEELDSWCAMPNIKPKIEIKRYDIHSDIYEEGDNYQYSEINYDENENGDWVKYDDIKHILERADNCGTVSSPKLPSLDEVYKHTHNYHYDKVEVIYYTIKKLMEK